MTKPPKKIQAFLRWFCRADCIDEIEGDITELFARESKESPLKARWKFAWRVLKCLRPEFIKSFESYQPAHSAMLKNYIKISWRSLKKNSTFSVINVIGLSASLAVGLFLIAVLSDISAFDRFHINYKNVYRVISRYEYLGNKDDNYVATTSLLTAKAIRESFTGVESMAVLRRGFDGDVSVLQKTIPLSGYFANDNLFDVFTFPFIQGNPATALKEPFSIVMTEKSAAKLFGTENAMGAVVHLNDHDYTVTGILKDVPLFSHMHFDMLGSLSTREVTEKDNNRELAWDNMWNTWVYVVIRDPENLPAVNENLRRLSAREDQTIKNTHIELSLQPLSDIMTGDDLSNQLGRTLGRSLILVFFGLTTVIILSACFNYTNLSVARSFRRAREVGIRKVVGAGKWQVRAQFVVEAVIISMMSLVAAVLFFQLVKPYFLALNPDLSELLRLELSPSLLISFFLFSLFIGLVAGLFPGLYFSRVNAILVLKGQASRVIGNLTGRKALIVAQYCISLMLITSTFLMYRQYKHFLNFDLGFNTKDVININLQGNKPDILINELREIPEVRNIARAGIITSVGTVWGEMMRNPGNVADSAAVRTNLVDENYLPLLEHQLLAGRNFNHENDGTVVHEVIVNEQVLKRFDIADRIPSGAIGEVVRFAGRDMTIIGVVKDFQYGRANNRSGEEVVFRYVDDKPDYLLVKFDGNKPSDVQSKLEAVWKKVDPVHGYDGRLYEDQIRAGFGGLDASMKVAAFIAALAIIIASLGMLGMVVYTTETRVKEVGIRKVMGASNRTLLYLLGKGFIMLLAVASLISLPVTFLFFDKIMLPMLANHAPILFFDMTFGALIVMTIALILIGSQTIKITRTNPASVLKNE